MVVKMPSLVDDRGAFTHLFCDSNLKVIVGQRRIVQINQSSTRLPRAVQGLRYQRPLDAEMKFVPCILGRQPEHGLERARLAGRSPSAHRSKMPPAA